LKTNYMIGEKKHKLSRLESSESICDFVQNKLLTGSVSMSALIPDSPFVRVAASIIRLNIS